MNAHDCGKYFYNEEEVKQLKELLPPLADSTLEIMILLRNLLDNAIEAAGKSGSDKIFQVIQKDKQLATALKNTCT